MNRESLGRLVKGYERIKWGPRNGQQPHPEPHDPGLVLFHTPLEAFFYSKAYG